MATLKILSPLIEHSAPSPSVLLSWLQERGITHHPSLEIASTSDSGLSIQAKAEIPLGSILCAIPKHLILSHKTASLRHDIPPPEFVSPADAILYLTACLLHELRLGKESGLYGWMQILPRDGVLIPTFWSECGEDGRKALEWLRGTEGEKELKRKNGEGLSYSDLQDYYNLVNPHLPLTTSSPEPSPLEHFLYAFSMVSSRGFVIDDYHTIGLIPFCDLFNHSTERACTSLLSNAGVCTECGKMRCEHRNLEESNQVTLTREDAEEEEDVVDMRVERAIKQGQEVLSCYEEEIGDGKLLVEWGFVEGKRGSLNLGFRDVLDGSTGRMFLQLRERGVIGSWNGTGLIVGGDDSLTMRITPDGRISTGLLLGIYLGTIKKADINIDSLEEDVMNLLKRFETTADSRVSEQSNDIHDELSEGILEQVEKRRASMCSPESSIAELRKLQSDLTGHSPLQSMALTLIICEREVLQRARDRWEEYGKKSSA